MGLLHAPSLTRCTPTRCEFLNKIKEETEVPFGPNVPTPVCSLCNRAPLKWLLDFFFFFFFVAISFIGRKTLFK